MPGKYHVEQPDRPLRAPRVGPTVTVVDLAAPVARIARAHEGVVTDERICRVFLQWVRARDSHGGSGVLLD
jgi:hypothetical protein